MIQILTLVRCNIVAFLVVLEKFKVIMKKIILPLVLGFALFLSSCTKDDQKMVNNLEGTWRITQAEEGHGSHSHSMDLEEAHELLFETITFSDCKLKDADCTGSMEFHGGATQAFDYTIDDDATIVTLTSNGISSIMEVISSDKDMHEFSTEAIEDGEVIEVTFLLEK